MINETIGVLLSRKQWNQLKKKDSNEYEICSLYTSMGEELNKRVLFFTLNHISLKEGTVKGAGIISKKLIHYDDEEIPPVIYSPTKYTKKKNIKQMRELCHKPNITVINEHHVIKNHHLIELIKEEIERSEFIEEGMGGEGIFTFTLIGQKNCDNEWEIPILYVKDLDENYYSFDEVKEFLTIYKEEPECIRKALVEKTEKILKKIHFYYPGVFEIGLTFTVNKFGQIKFKTNSSIYSILKDLMKWQAHEEVFKRIVKWPIQLAGRIKYTKAEEESGLGTVEQIEKQFNDNSEQQPTSEGVYWVKFRTFSDKRYMINLPGEMIGNCHTLKTNLEFGIKKQPCAVTVIDNVLFPSGNTYQTPIEVTISSALFAKMHLHRDIVFQMQVLNNKLVVGPTVGFLLGEKNQIYNPDYMEKYSDRLGKYETFGGLVIAFSTRSINWQEKIAYGMIYNPTRKTWEYGSSPIPSSLYRRNFHQDEARIQRLIKLTNHRLFNSYHFKKSDLYRLQSHPKIKEFLPVTNQLVDLNELIDFVQEKKKVILKPAYLSRGRGIYIIEKCHDEFIIYDYTNKYKVCHIAKGHHVLVELLNRFQIMNEDYLFQTYIPLLRINHRPFDVRVVMQKYAARMWRCSGIECRIAGENEELTNIARGGDVKTLDQALKESGSSLNYHSVYKRILEVCQRFCEVMDETNHHFAEFGLDIALDSDGNIWILEANIFPSFKGFKIMDYETYLTIRYQPLEYAVLIQNFTITEEEEICDEMYDKN